MNVKQLAWLVTSIILAGCSYVGVVATADPLKMLHQGESMQQAGRHIPAEQLGLRALERGVELGDKRAQANAHRYLGNFYKSRLYFERADWFRSVDRFDPSYELSKSHFQQAAALWEEIGDDWGVAAEYFNLGNVASLQENSDGACDLYSRSLAAYGTATFQGTIHPWSPAYPDFPSMVRAFAEHEGCEEFD